MSLRATEGGEAISERSCFAPSQAYLSFGLQLASAGFIPAERKRTLQRPPHPHQDIYSLAHLGKPTHFNRKESLWQKDLFGL